MFVIMSNYFWNSSINKLAVSLFILCSYLQEVQTGQFVSWEHVITDLKQIIQTPTKIDASLYTAESADNSSLCRISVVKCFYLEMKVLSDEADIEGYEKVSKSAKRIMRSVGRFLEDKQGKETPQCRECETFEEKQYTEFIKKFQHIASIFLREERERQFPHVTRR